MWRWWPWGHSCPARTAGGQRESVSDAQWPLTNTRDSSKKPLKFPLQLNFLTQKHVLCQKEYSIVLSTACVCSVTQSCPTRPWPHGLPGSSGHGIFRQEYWSRLPFPPPGDLPNLGTEPKSPTSPALQVDSLPAEPSGKPQTLCMCAQASLILCDPRNCSWALFKLFCTHF